MFHLLFNLLVSTEYIAWCGAANLLPSTLISFPFHFRSNTHTVAVDLTVSESFFVFLELEKKSDPIKSDSV